MAKLLKLRRGTTSQHGSFTGAEGEVTVDTDKETLVVHDGSTAGGHAVAAEDMANVSSANIVGRLGTGSIVKAKLEADIIDSTKLADDAVNSEHYVDGSIDTAHIADAQVTHVKLSNDCIDGDNVQDDVINSEHLAAGAVDLEHMSSESVDEDNLKISNSGTNGNFLQKQSGNTGGLTWAAVDLSAYAPLASPTFTGTANGANLTLSGNLTVNGTTTTVATTNTTLTDNLLELNSGASSNANDSGILIERGSTGDNAIIAWDESADKFTVGTTTGTASSTGNISITTGTLVANTEGHHTGDSTGNVTGNITGNAGTATQLATARNIGGVSFNGTAAINLPGVNTAGNQNTSGNAATATQLATARTIGGTSFNGSANITPAQATNADTVDNLHAASFIRADAADVATGRIAFQGNATSNHDDIASSTGSLGGIEVYNVDSGNDAFMAFHTGSDFGLYFGLDADSNSLAVGGWSMGAVKHKVIHQGNVGSGDALSSTTVYTGNIRDSKGDARDIPSAAKSSAYTLVNTDGGKVIYTSSGGVTLPNSVMASGNTVTIINNSGSDITITQASGLTVYNAADAATGNRTLAARGMATVWYASGSVAYISGAGLS